MDKIKYSETKGGKNFLKAIEWHENKKGRKWFFFGDVISKWDDKNKCGSVCCFVGNTPFIFPERIKWNVRDKYISRGAFTGVRDLFKLNFTVCDIFIPGCQKGVHESLRNLPEYCTPKALCKELRKFIQLIDNGELRMNGTKK